MAPSSSSPEATEPQTNGDNATTQPYNFRSRKSGNRTSVNEHTSNRNDDCCDGLGRLDNVDRPSTLGDIDDDDNNNNNNSVDVEMHESSRRTNRAGRVPKVSKNKTTDDSKDGMLKEWSKALKPKNQTKWKKSTYTLRPLEQQHLVEMDWKETEYQKSQKAVVGRWGGKNIADYEGRQRQIQQMLERAATSNTSHRHIKPFNGQIAPGEPYRTETLTIVPSEIFNPDQHERSAFCTHCKRLVDCSCYLTIQWSDSTW